MGTRILSAYTDNGTAFRFAGPEDRPVVLLIHGLGLDRSTWDPFVPALAEHYRVLRYDLFGHGESAPPPGTPSLRMFSGQIIDLLASVGVERCTAVGFSLGGMINRRLAMDRPELVSGLAILNSPHERSAEAQIQVEDRARDSTSGGPGANLDETLERWFTPRFRLERPDVVGAVRDGVLRNEAVTYAQCRFVLANGVVELVRPKPPITRPTLVMTSENDTGSTPDMSRAIAREIDGSELVIVPELQHLGLLEQPREFLRPLLAFLSRHLNPTHR